MAQGNNSEAVEQREDVQLRDVWNLLARSRPLISACTLLVVGAAAGLTFTAVPLYEAITRIRIDEGRKQGPGLDIFQAIAGRSQVETEMEVLRSRPLAEDVVRELHLQLALHMPRGVARSLLLSAIHVEEWAPAGYWVLSQTQAGQFRAVERETHQVAGTYGVGEPVALSGATFTLTEAALEHLQIDVEVKTFDQAAIDLREALSVSRPNREADLITVQYQSTDTLLVHRVPNALAARFIVGRQNIQKTEARSTVQFLYEQIDTLSAQLRVAENALQSFREGEQVVSLEAEAQAQVTQRVRMQADRNTLDAERAALQTLLDEIEGEQADPDPQSPSAYRRLIAFPSLLRNAATSELLRSLNAVETPLADLLNRRTPEDPDVLALQGRVDALENQLRSIAVTYLAGLTNQVRSLDATLERFGIQLELIPAREVQYARLERQTTVLEQMYTLLQTRLKEAEIAQAVEDPTVRVVEPAIRPIEPIKPRKALNMIVGLFLGLTLGVAAAFTRSFLDDTIHSPEDVGSATGGIPVLGIIPQIKQTSLNGKARKAKIRGAGDVAHLESRLVTGRDPRNPVSEAYRSLRTNLTFSRPGHPPKTLVFTSPMPQEGKSTSAANLAITLAQQSLRVLLIDADLRRGLLHSVFQTPREPGLSDVLIDKAQADDVIQPVSLGQSGTLDFLSTGTLPPNPAELLGSSQMKQLLKSLEEKYDTIILDSPPLNVVTDAAVLGTKADGVLLVARANQTEYGALRFALSQLENVRAPVVGSVLNDVDYKRDVRYYGSYGSSGYYYQYYYGHPEKEKAKG